MLVLGIITIVSVIGTPLLGILGAFNGGTPDKPTTEYFLPAGYAFSVWGIIYAGCIGWGIFMALPRQRMNTRLMAAAPFLALSAALNLVWMFFASQSGALSAMTLPVLLGMEITAWLAYFRLGINGVTANDAEGQGVQTSRFERVLQFSTRVYVGWLSVATVANSASALNALGWDAFGISPITWTVMMLIAATLVAVLVGGLAKQDNVYRSVFVWAFVGIIVKQLAYEPIVYAAFTLLFVLVGVIIFTEMRKTRRIEMA